MDATHVTHDGSPVAVYLAVPAGDGPQLIHGCLDGPSTILELGAGAGRLTRVLVAYGHHVTAVDDDPRMLAHVTGAEAVCQDLYDLDLGRRFDAVVAASHLVNVADRDRRNRLLEVAARHVAPDGVVVVERHELDWAREPTDISSQLGPVELEVAVGQRAEGMFSAVVTYRLGDHTWHQPFTAVVVDDDDLQQLASGVGLGLDRWLNDAGTWVALRPEG